MSFNAFLKGLSIFGMAWSVVMCVYDFAHGHHVLGLLMIGCFFLNLNTYRGCRKS